MYHFRNVSQTEEQRVLWLAKREKKEPAKICKRDKIEMEARFKVAHFFWTS